MQPRVHASRGRRYNRSMLIPAPVVVDADVLLRNVDYPIRTGRTGALLGQASPSYSLLSGVVLFATAQVKTEAVRHLPDIAERRRVDLDVVHGVWNQLIVPNVRFVKVRLNAVDDPRVREVRRLHAPDAHTAALVALLAPAVLATDNRRHFAPFGLPQTRTDEVAVDLFALGQFGLGVKGALLLPGVAGAMTIDGSKRLIAKLGGDVAATIGLVLLGGVALFLTSERGREFRSSLAGVARRAGPPLSELMATMETAGDRVGAFAVERVTAPDALAVVARRLAVGQSVMTTREVAQELRLGGFQFDDPGRLEAQISTWMAGQPCFRRWAQDRWTLGYHAAEL